MGEVVELADVFCVLGLRRDDVGGLSLAAARACYREVQKWPRPWCWRPWLLADLHWDKLRKEGGYAIHDRDLPNLDRATSLSVLCGEGLPELGALLDEAG